MVLWMGGCGGRVRLPKRMIMGSSLLMMILLYYASLPEPLMYSGGDGRGHKGPLADDTEIVMNVGHGERISHGSWMKAKGEQTIGKSSKQRNYNFQDSRADAGSCGLVSNDNSDSGSCAPPSGKRHKGLENNRFAIAIEENDVPTSEIPSKNLSVVSMALTTAKEQESIQEGEGDQGSERKDGSMTETEEERMDREEKETITATIEAEIEREEAEFREMNKDKDDSDDDEGQEDDGASGGDKHQFAESLFRSDQESTEEEEEYRKEDRLGQAGPLETMDDEE
ncbi:hypothetical protein BG006_008321 [Podila minutissima]|uniref:Uncharacterized protein n=1 Tax=Podila minutissima TaxID=64525 RepID=A0A9P5SR97_9FUNG|nr:hypothetical protein BG006_008321 [Podila minutissima]